MTSILFLLLSVLAIQECWGKEQTCNCKSSQKPRDCQELQQLGNLKNGAYIIWLRDKFLEGRPILVYCDMETAGGGWTVIQRRGSYATPADYFNKTWSHYKEGFGDVQRELWLGNDNIFDLTNQKVYSVYFDLTSYAGAKGHAEYTSFYIDGEDNNYSIHIKNYSGSAGDVMTSHDGQTFSTPDRDNDSLPNTHCAGDYGAGWWYKKCYTSNLNGKRGRMDGNKNVRWTTFKDNTALEKVEIKIRPRS